MLVELRGLEPLTLCMPCRCATSCATAPGVARGGSPADNSRNLSQPPAAREIGRHRDHAVVGVQPPRRVGGGTAKDRVAAVVHAPQAERLPRGQPSRAARRCGSRRRARRPGRPRRRGPARPARRGRRPSGRRPRRASPRRRRRPSPARRSGVLRGVGLELVVVEPFRAPKEYSRSRGVEGRGEAADPRRRTTRVAGPVGVRGPQPGRVERGDRRRDRLGLGVAEVVELGVGVALDPARDVPVGPAVPEQEQLNRAVTQVGRGDVRGQRDRRAVAPEPLERVEPRSSSCCTCTTMSP